MSEKIELTAADLALYLGCECRLFNIINGVLEYERDGTLCGIRPQSIHQNRVLVNVKSEHGRIMELAYLYCEVKPILRPLSDMTEEEYMEVQYRVDKIGLGYDAQQGAEITRYLLSKHFDLFGWIPAGLAIDKTKIQ